MRKQWHRELITCPRCLSWDLNRIENKDFAKIIKIRILSFWGDS